ncbi:MAG: hypothetical protein E8A46_12055 [Bradyrhizobium sp.]|uniref:hypothetical protein n=1 Tax=Bradyrhizobium sp. TaxID=376 RepID=UPI0011FF333B|nr:hypothetical protein [Bradyrhizobium sp.]THD52945.1 MAG: hypothetical protein E8A46_12055 [Bradyrhizobium sp.]
MIEFSQGFVSIGSDRPVPLAGRAGSPRVVGDVEGTLEANMLAVFSEGACRAVFVSIDALFVGRELSDILLSACADFGVANEAVLITATQTHSAPALEDTKPALGRRCDDHFADVRKKLTRLVSDVLTARPQQGKVTKGRSAIDASVNRRLPWHLPQLTRRGVQFERTVFAPNRSGTVDPLITAIVIRGESIAVVWHYTCHPSGFPVEKISADYPGIVRQALRQRFGKDTASIFLQGFTGDIRPVSGARPPGLMPLVRRAVQGPCFYDMKIENWRGWAKSISNGVMQAIDAATSIEDDVPMSGRIASTTLDKVMSGGSRNRLVEVQHLHCFGERILAVSAEPLLGLKDICPTESLLVGYSRDVFGYWPREMQLGLGGYEVNGFKDWFGVAHTWQSGLDDVFSELVKY